MDITILEKEGNTQQEIPRKIKYMECTNIFYSLKQHVILNL